MTPSFLLPSAVGYSYRSLSMIPGTVKGLTARKAYAFTASVPNSLTVPVQDMLVSVPKLTVQVASPPEIPHISRPLRSRIFMLLVIEMRRAPAQWESGSPRKFNLHHLPSNISY